MVNTIPNESTTGLELAVAPELFCVTLEWQSGDRGQGDYSVSVWAVDEDDAIRQVAEEMADSGEMSFETDAERAEYIQGVIDGAGQFAAERVKNRVLSDLNNLLKDDHPDALKAIMAILGGALSTGNTPSTPKTHLDVPGAAVPSSGAGTELFSAAQRVVLENYASGDFKHMLELTSEDLLRQELAECGDGLLRYLMVELSPTEDCASLADAVDRIEQTINDLEALQIPLQDA